MILIRQRADVPEIRPTSGCWAGPVMSRLHMLAPDSPVTFSQWAWGQSLFRNPVEADTGGTESGPGTPLGSLEMSICATAQDLNEKLPEDKH